MRAYKCRYVVANRAKYARHGQGYSEFPYLVYDAKQAQGAWQRDPEAWSLYGESALDPYKQLSGIKNESI